MLKDKVVLITGGSKGLGKAVALKLAERGTNLALLARSEEVLNKTVAEIKKKFQTKVEGYTCDVSKPEQVQDTIKNIIKDFSRIDILINNAGIWWEGDLEEHSDKKLRELFEINTLGYIYMVKYVTPIMKKQKGGQILNVVSVAGIDYEPGWAPYTTTKHAVRAFTESIRKVYAKDNIKVMAIYPPGMDTEIFESAGFHYGKNAEWMMKKEKVADIIIYMLSQPTDVVLNHVEVRKLGYL